MSLLVTTMATAADYTEQAEVTDWPARVALVIVMVALIALALWGMRRGWVHRQQRQADLPAPADAPPDGFSGEQGIGGLFAGTGVHGDWMDRIAVHDLGVRSRAELSWDSTGIWIARHGARSLFIPADAVLAVRSDRGVAGTVRAQDSMVLITWRLGDRDLDTGYRADASSEHHTLLDGLMATFSTGVR